jgi:hypothetical protein
MLNFDDSSHLRTFQTKELGPLVIYCKQISMWKGVSISNDYCSIDYNPENGTGKIKILTDEEDFKKNCGKSS